MEQGGFLDLEKLSNSSNIGFEFFKEIKEEVGTFSDLLEEIKRKEEETESNSITVSCRRKLQNLFYSSLPTKSIRSNRQHYDLSRAKENPGALPDQIIK